MGGDDEGDGEGDDEAAPRLGDVEVVRVGAITEVHVRGEVDIAITPAFDAAVDVARRAGATELVMDLTEVTFIGSSGLAGLLRAQRRMREGGGRLVLAKPSRAVKDLLEMTKLLERFGLSGEDQPPVGPAG